MKFEKSDITKLIEDIYNQYTNGIISLQEYVDFLNSTENLLNKKKELLNSQEQKEHIKTETVSTSKNEEDEINELNKYCSYIECGSMCDDNNWQIGINAIKYLLSLEEKINYKECFIGEPDEEGKIVGLIPNYIVTWETNESSEHLRDTESLENAYDEAEMGGDIEHYDYDYSSEIRIYFNEVEFIFNEETGEYEIEDYIDENIEPYMMVERYNSSENKPNIYKRLDKLGIFDEDVIYHKEFRKEDESVKLLDEVFDNLYKDLNNKVIEKYDEKFVLHFNGNKLHKYNNVSIFKLEDFEKEGKYAEEYDSFTLRVSDHRYNKQNNYSEDKFLSLEITDNNPTAKKFYSSQDYIEFNSDNDYSDVLEGVIYYIKYFIID